MNRLGISLLLLLSPGLALACAAQEEIFSCKIGSKQARLCQAPGKVVYTFGKAGKPEIVLSTPNDTVRDKTMSTASGKEQNFYFSNQGVRYLVFHMSDVVDGSVLDAGVVVRPKAGEFVRLSCKEGTVRFNPKAIKARANEIHDIPRNWE